MSDLDPGHHSLERVSMWRLTTAEVMSKQSIEVRQVNSATAKAELSLQIDDVKSTVAKLREAQAIPYETMRLQFTI